MSKWFDKRYTVNCESIKVLEELVFAAGGRWLTDSPPFNHLDENGIIVGLNGAIHWCDNLSYEDGTAMLNLYMEYGDVIECNCTDASIVEHKGTYYMCEFESYVEDSNGRSYVYRGESGVGFIFSYCADLKFYKPKRETIEVNGNTYFKDEYEKAIAGLTVVGDDE